MTITRSKSTPTILFGAFDRHNFGDLLFPHIVSRLLGNRELRYAGLAERDLRLFGGHRVSALAQLAKELGGAQVNILHAGGELLTCDAWQAAVMLQQPDEARAIIKRLDGHPTEQSAWAQQVLSLAAQAPYTVPATLLSGVRKIVYNAVGGVALDKRDDTFRREVVTNLQRADLVSVRDEQTRHILDSMGVASRLTPDPAVMVAELCAAEIEAAARSGECALNHGVFPQGYLAVQFSAEFGDDATLLQLAEQLDEVIEQTGYGVVLFRAGAAPWHDELSCYRRMAGYMRSSAVAIFESLNIWDICAVIANSRCFCGRSLHGRIVAMAYALPRANLSHPSQEGSLTKQQAYATSWDTTGSPTTIAINTLAVGVRQALDIPEARLQRLAQELVYRYRSEFALIHMSLE